MKVINLFGVPGSGKSTGAAYIFSELKMYGKNVELITEFAKDKVYEENQSALSNQAYIFGKQSYRMSKCKDKVDYLVTDSPLLLSALYNQDPVLGGRFNDIVADVFNSYVNMNFLIKRTKPYMRSGRIQTEQESDDLVIPLKALLDKYDINYFIYNGERHGYEQIVKYILTCE